MNGPSYHGRTHIEQGTDPIPGLGDLPWAYGEADLQTDGSNADYFTTAISDLAPFSYDGGTKKWTVSAAGVYQVFNRANLETSDASPLVTARLAISPTYSSGAGGNFVGGVLEDTVKAGVLNLAGSSRVWNLNGMDVLSIDETQVPVTVYVIASASDAGDYLLGLNTLFVRTARVSLLNPF